MGPVASSSARAWTEWAREMIAALRDAPVTSGLPCEVLDSIHTYLDVWAHTANLDGDGAFRWRAEVPAEELVYLTNALYNLDQCFADLTHQHPGKAQPAEGRVFHVVLVEALIFALTQEGRSEAAFAGQLRPWWPEVV